MVSRRELLRENRCVHPHAVPKVAAASIIIHRRGSDGVFHTTSPHPDPKERKDLKNSKEVQRNRRKQQAYAALKELIPGSAQLTTTKKDTYVNARKYAKYLLRECDKLGLPTGEEIMDNPDNKQCMQLDDSDRAVLREMEAEFQEYLTEHANDPDDIIPEFDGTEVEEGAQSPPPPPPHRSSQAFCVPFIFQQSFLQNFPSVQFSYTSHQETNSVPQRFCESMEPLRFYPIQSHQRAIPSVAEEKKESGTFVYNEKEDEKKTPFLI